MSRSPASSSSRSGRSADGYAQGRVPHRRREERHTRSEEHTSELQSLMRISYAVFCLKKKKKKTSKPTQVRLNKISEGQRIKKQETNEQYPYIKRHTPQHNITTDNQITIIHNYDTKQHNNLNEYSKELTNHKH